jgi:uncharacterized protein (DUF1697 family)
MQNYIALLRGINVGGHHKLPMKELRILLGELGLENVQTYIASGNVVFQSDRTDTGELTREISSAIEANHGFKPRILLLTGEEIETAVKANPFPDAESDHKSLHFYFLLDEPKNPDLAALQELKQDNESFELIDKVFYLHAPDGIGRSKLAEKVERHLGQPTTARNWRTVSKILEMLP